MFLSLAWATHNYTNMGIGWRHLARSFSDLRYASGAEDSWERDWLRRCLKCFVQQVNQAQFPPLTSHRDDEPVLQCSLEHFEIRPPRHRRRECCRFGCGAIESCSPPVLHSKSSPQSICGWILLRERAVLNPLSEVLGVSTYLICDPRVYVANSFSARFDVKYKDEEVYTQRPCPARLHCSTCWNKLLSK